VVGGPPCLKGQRSNGKEGRKMMKKKGEKGEREKRRKKKGKREGTYPLNKTGRLTFFNKAFLRIRRRA